MDFVHTVCSESEPLNYKSTLQIPYWHQAMRKEYNALCEQNTWMLVPPPTTH